MMAKKGNMRNKLKNKKKNKLKPVHQQKRRKPQKSKPKCEESKADDHDSESDFEEVSANTSHFTDGSKGFPSLQSDQKEEDEDDECENTRKLVQQQNRKKKKSGGFQSMGLSHAVFTGIIRKGYKIPTPIQRKTVPIILDGKDVVAMARTGSGKTAAFLIPMFEKLKTHTAQSGSRALVLSPTRELALQTLKFTKELGRFTGLRSAVVLGGDRMEDQFAALHENPDIIIATPGRFMHVLVEMEMKLSAVEYVVFDEADRLFEMGFQVQLHEIIQRLPESRQTLLFSATLPKLLVDFAKAGLHDPTLIRLDVDSKLSEQLKLSFMQCRTEDKTAVLLYLLRCVIKPSEQTVVFVATKHHVEYLNMILMEAGISCSYSYSALDQTARKINVAKFRNKKTMVLVVTDIAARGIDIPLLDNVINFNFPGKPKLFVHRVGRVARAGRSGTAYSLVGHDEVAHVIDLHLFLGRPMKIVKPGRTNPDEDGLFGGVPQVVIDDEEDNLRLWHAKTDIESMRKVVGNAYKQYIKSRPVSASESIKRAKEQAGMQIGMHPIFATTLNSSVGKEEARNQLLNSMKNYKPNNTVFEVNSTKKTSAFDVMKQKRNLHGGVIANVVKKREDGLMKDLMEENPRRQEQEMSSQADIENVFSRVVFPRAQMGEKVFQTKTKRKDRAGGRDEEHYLHYRPTDFNTEKGLSMGTSFEQEATSAVLDLAGDEESHLRQQQGQLKWDRKRKKYIQDTGRATGKKKIKTESGQWISATFKQDIYKNWLERSKMAEQDDDDEASEEEGAKSATSGSKRGLHVSGTSRRGKGFHKSRQLKEKTLPGKTQFGKGKKGRTFPGSAPKRELKRKEEILKDRRKKAKREGMEKFRQGQRNKKQKH